MCLEPYGTVHSLDELMVQAKRRNYLATFKRNDLPLRDSLLYHLKNFMKDGYVRLVEDARSLEDL